MKGREARVLLALLIRRGLACGTLSWAAAAGQPPSNWYARSFYLLRA